MTRLIAAIVLSLLLTPVCLAQADAESRSWNQPVEPFRLLGNIYYVGASGVTSFLITSPHGHILIDGGFPETAPMIEKNIGRLGFNLRDVKILLLSHAHYDHAGGLAELKRKSGARLLVSEADTAALRNGGRGDFAWGDRFLMPPVMPDGTIVDGQRIELGGSTLTARITPGHTRGCTTWTTNVEEAGKRYNVVFSCSVTVPGYTLVNNSAYPEIIEDYQRSFRILKSLPCDVLLAPHSEFFQMKEKAARLRAGDATAFVDPAGCRAYVNQSERSFQRELEKQRREAKR